MIDNHCIKCGRPLRDGKCAYGCDRFGNYKRYNNNQQKKQTRKTEMKTKQTEEEEYYKPLSVEERRMRRKEGVQHLKKLINALPRVFRNTQLWKKYGEINHE